MKRLVEREFPAGTVEAKVSGFLSEAERFESPAGAKQRVRARLLGAPVRANRPWLLRTAVVFGVLAVAALAGAGVWRSKSRLHAPASIIDRTAKAPDALAAPAAQPEVAKAESAPTTGNDSIAEPSSKPQPAPSAHRESLAAAEASVLFEATGALRRDGDAARASRILDDYFRKFPRGALGEEALALAIEAASVRGDARARSLAKRYLDLYPRGNFRTKAERVLAKTGD